MHDHTDNHMGSSDVCLLIGTVHEEASGQAQVTGSVETVTWSGAAIGTGFGGESSAGEELSLLAWCFQGTGWRFRRSTVIQISSAG